MFVFQIDLCIVCSLNELAQNRLSKQYHKFSKLEQWVWHLLKNQNVPSFLTPELTGKMGFNIGQ